jgi:hypothetical protein
MIEYRRISRSFSETAQRASVMTDERNTTMNDMGYYNAVAEDRKRDIVWVNQNAWMYEQARQRRQRRQRRYREAVAQMMRAVAERIAPVDADAVGEPGRLVVERRA